MTTTELEVKTWTSDDWADTPRAEAPHNGIEIEASPVYIHDELMATKVVITDYTKTAEGESWRMSFAAPFLGLRQAIDAASPSTLEGVAYWKMAPEYPGEVALFVDLTYGLPDGRHHVEGPLLSIPFSQPS